MLGRYVLRRLLSSVPVLLGVTFLTFALLHATSSGVVPGIGFNPRLRPEDVASLRRALGLDQPLPVQYWDWMTGLLHGDLGRSIVDGTPVTSLILARLPNTLELTVSSLLLALVVSIPLGALGALRRGSVLDHLLTLLSVAGVSIPSFWLALLLILFFSVTLHGWGLPFLPSSGATDPLAGGDPIDRLAHLLMPATCLALVYIVTWSRFTRSALLEVLSQDYVRTARAKGMAERRVVSVHALRNAIAPLITLVGLELPSLFGGSAVIEIVFSWPGIGRLALERALEYDYPTVLGLVTFAGVLVIAGNLLADVLNSLVDPRVRLR